ncbi:flagellar biosynthetic protein FliO [Dissulfurirhabdus thermomarina]|uniref:Flagellar protein n=1 Tax=Dissulfurirhabdus thermomarina TaxID=1765737 RepID=A0A6N9TRH5_DISTH|nr:flagellar biosynthetic protein FliO [Dissulfurirhabdus thermomarina]NDY42713.1 flagellar biosynthetic protein FliO [Dissulfurirhabdus thermomarina]NMX24466.1 flagellar biosynthetic protein FliO [Dissulfurirhabdus thermomarina]
METTGMVLRMIGALGVILGLLGAAAWGLRRWGGLLQGGRQDLVEVLATRMVLPKKFVCVVRVAEKVLVLGASEQGLRLLDTLEGPVPAAGEADRHGEERP